jgi:hypothetical protein
VTPAEIRDYVDNRVDARMEEIAENAAKKALQLIYSEIGQGLVKKLVWLVGIVGLALLSWMAGRGMKLPSP